MTIRGEAMTTMEHDRWDVITMLFSKCLMYTNVLVFLRALLDWSLLPSQGSVKYYFLSLVVVLMQCICVLTEALSGIVMHCNGCVMEILAQNY